MYAAGAGRSRFVFVPGQAHLPRNLDGGIVPLKWQSLLIDEHFVHRCCGEVGALQLACLEQ